MQSCTSVVLTQEELIDFVEENFGIRIPTSLLPTDWYIAAMFMQGKLERADFYIIAY